MSSDGLSAATAGVADGPDGAVNELIASIQLVDHHTHSIVSGPIAPADVTFMLTESDRPAAAIATGLDSQVGVALRRWCAPLLGLAPHAAADDYLARRGDMANEEVAARLLPAAGLERLIVETGYRGDEVLPPSELGRIAGARTSSVVRLESVAEQLASSGIAAAAYPDAFRAALASAAASAVGVKSIVAYRAGLDFDPARPADAEVVAHAGDWLRRVERTGSARLDDPVLLRFGLWEGAALGRPLQIHTGYGDPDLDLHRCDPLLLTDFLRATESTCPVLLLHTYPFHRHAGYLAQMFGHLYVDVGLAVNYAGAASPRIVAESLELAPFTKILFSSDAWGLPELHLLGSWLFRRALSRILGAWVRDGDWSLADAERATGLIAAENARRVYGLVDGP